MTRDSELIRIDPEELPELLTRLEREKATDFVLVGREGLTKSQEHWPKPLQGRVVYQLAAELPGLPSEILRLGELKTLSLRSLGLRSEAAIAIAKNLGQLTMLDLAGNAAGESGIRAISESLVGLRSLDLSSNRVTEAGASAIAKMIHLTSLNLSGSKVSELGVITIAESLDRLKSLNLTSNRLGESVAHAISENLVQLTSLELGSIDLSESGARAVAENLVNLESLSLWNCQIGDPGARAIAENLVQLMSLDLSTNQVGEPGVYAITENLFRLNSLDLSSNQLNDAGASLIAMRLNRLTSLHLWDNEVGDLGAHAIAENLVHLKTLDLWDNQVGDLGARAIAENLNHLSSLDLSDNQLGEPGVLAIAKNLHDLRSLHLSGCRLGESVVHAITENLVHLTSLDLSYNQLGDSSVRSIAESLGRLTSLNLMQSDVGDEGVAAIGENLRQIADLDLGANTRVTTVAPLKPLKLSRLSISDTNVTDLSPLRSHILGGLPVHEEKYGILHGINVADCRLTNPPPDVVSQGPEAVLNFFREIEAQGVDRLFEAKLLIVGEGGAGKTSLLRRLFLPEMDLPEEDETTRGIDIHHHEFSVSDERNFRLNAWDFGGQQIYHSTHQFFLTKRSLYVLVDDTRKNNRSVQDEGFKYWLDVVETLSEGSPLLIFQNEKDGRSKQIDEAGIKGRFPNLQAVHRGDLEKLDAADDLRRAVEYFVQQLPHIGEDVPAKWVVIRKDLEKLAATEPYISLEKYMSVYERHLEADRDKALHLSRYFHDLGVFLHFQQQPELRRTVFLQNEWVTEAVFRILDDEGVKSQKGRFTLADCDRLWADQGYAEKDVELRALMVRFELCYRLPDQDEEAWLVPQHLPPSKPADLNDWAQAGDLVLTFRYDFLPRGLASRLIVRMHRFIRRTELSWSHGALFEYGETQVLVETADGEIVLRARGAEKKALLSVIASDLDALNASFQGLKEKVGKWVPCDCGTCMGLTEPAMFAMKDLIDRKRRGKPTIECPKPPDYTDVSVIQLLDGMRLEEWLEQGQELSTEEPEPEPEAPKAKRPAKARQAPERSKPAKTVRIFLASSSELREDRDAFDLYFRQLNDRRRQSGLYLEIVRWESFLDAMSTTRLQEEYNQAIRDCDLFVSLFKTKTGKYTEEEFDVAHQAFLETGKPQIYTYFRKATVSTSSSHREDLISLWDFQKKLDELGHFYTEYPSVEGLKQQFRDQLDKLQDQGSL